MRSLCLCVLLALIGCSRSHSRDGLRLQISEVLPDNGNAGEGSAFDFDWIELYNPNDVTIDVGGFYLSDSAANLRKWKIPLGTMIDPGGYRVVAVGARDESA